MEFSGVHMATYEVIILGKFLLNVHDRLVPVKRRLELQSRLEVYFRARFLPFLIYHSFSSDPLENWARGNGNEQRLKCPPF